MERREGGGRAAISSVLVNGDLSDDLTGLTVAPGRPAMATIDPDPGLLSASPNTLARPVSPVSMPSLSPTTTRRRIRLVSKRNLEAILGASPPSFIHLRLARDPIQPRTGSISDVHSEASAEDEEADFFPLEVAPRPRSVTCPENRAFQRRVKARARNRPPTPPPGGSGDDPEFEAQISRLVSREKLKIPLRDLPQVVETDSTGVSRRTMSCDSGVISEATLFDMDD